MENYEEFKRVVAIYELFMFTGLMGIFSAIVLVLMETTLDYFHGGWILNGIIVEILGLQSEFTYVIIGFILVISMFQMVYGIFLLKGIEDLSEEDKVS